MVIIPYIEYHNCPFRYISNHFLFKTNIPSVTILSENNRLYNYSQKGYDIGLNNLTTFSFDKSDMWTLRFKYAKIELVIFLL